MQGSDERDVIENDINFSDLPDNYPAYLLFVPTAMGTDNEKKIYERLTVFGNNMGENLCVARIDQKKGEYREFLRKIGENEMLSKPAIIITDKNEISSDTLIIRLDEKGIVTNEEKLIEILPEIVDLVISEQDLEAMKRVLKEKKKTLLLSALQPALTLLSNIKVKVSLWDGLTIETK
jgi:hypothetical protein